MSGTSEDNLRGKASSIRPELIPARAVRLRAGLAFLTIWALFSMILEILILQQVDSLRLYMTGREIAVDAGVALLLLLGLATAWWLLVLILGQAARTISATQRFSFSLSWFLWLVPPFSYLVARLSEAAKLRIAPLWHVHIVLEILYALVLIFICVKVLRSARLAGLQQFCESRLAPIGWIHLCVCVIFLAVLLGRGVYLFHNYANPGRSAAASDRPDIYLITVDALRADGMSVYGYSRPTTPALEQFAQRSFTFDYFFANSNFTTPATISIETGKLPWSHRVFQFGGFLRQRAQHENLADVLRQNGYYTAMVSSNFVGSPFHHGTLASYDAVEYVVPQGVQGWWMRLTNLVGANTQSTLAYSLLRRLYKFCEYADGRLWHGRYFSPAEAAFAQTRNLLERPDVGQPRFVWTHIFPPHDPYWPPPPYDRRFSSPQARACGDMEISNPKKLPRGVTTDDLRACYDEMVLYADHVVGDYLNWLEQTGRMEKAVVIISSDHGESFEDNWYLHGGARLSSGLIHVPLLIHMPAQQQGQRISQLSQQVDLLPTILDIAGAAVPAWTDGTSLRPALQGGALPERYIVSMNLESERSFAPISKGTLAILDKEFKFVRGLGSGQQTLYRYRTDTREQNDLSNSEPYVTKRMQDELLLELRKANEAFAARQARP